MTPMPHAFDWSSPRFIPVDIDARNDEVVLSAGGQEVRLRGPLFRIDADGPLKAEYGIEKREFLVLSLELTAEKTTFLRHVAWLPGEWSGIDARVISSTAMQDNALFLRAGNVSFFLSLDFPCSRITGNGIAYPPHEVIPTGSIHACHTLTIGACRLSGDMAGDYDRAEIEAMSAYLEQRFPPRFDRPLVTSACITNRMTDCRDGIVFYSMHDNPTLALNPKLLAEDIRLMARIGVEYFQVFEGVFDWPDERRTGAALRRLVALGRRLGVRIGDYVNPQGLYCQHYNYSRRQLDRPEWLQRRVGGTAGNFCLGSREYVDAFKDRLVEHNRVYGEEFICFDFLGIAPCYAEEHGHPAGDVYHQVKALVDIFQALNALSPDFLVWSNSGNWLEFMPKLTWYNPNVYLTDPHVRGYAPGLNFLKFLGDGRREQMVSVHERYFVPYRAFTNCEYYAFPRSRVPDLREFEYSFLQGLAVTPNICPAETRVFLDRIPASRREDCIRFMRRWTNFLREHFHTWRRTARVGDVPGPGATEIYAHIDGDAGFICLVNQNPYPRTARFALDETLGLAQSERFTLHEIYPRECPLAEQPLPFAERGEEITCIIPPHAVRFLEIKPFAPAEGVRIHGLPAVLKRTPAGYRATLRAPQGETIRLGVMLPSGEAVTSVTARQTPTVPMYTFPASARLVEARGNVARVEITFPREQTPRALTRWRVTPGDVEMELPRAECAFLGGLVTGAFSEEYEVQLDLRIAPTDEEGRLQPSIISAPSSAQVPSAPRQTFTTEFTLPFIEPAHFGMMPDFNDDTVLELAFADPARVDDISARLNGQPVEVRRYAYPKRADWYTFYLDLTGQASPGRQRLEVEVCWLLEA